MWADKNWYKVKKRDLKDGIDGDWTYTGTHLYNSPFNACWNNEPHTDNEGEDVVKVHITIEEEI